MNTLQQHPLSAAFPPMLADEQAQLTDDIIQHGQREPGVTFEGKVLDGWHRYLACYAAGVDFLSVEFDGGDPVAFVKSKNWHRRHLSASQKAAAEVALHEWAGSGRNHAPGAGLKTNAEMAEDAGVSERTIQHAKAAHQAGLGDAVRKGDLSAKDAAAIAKLPKAKREKALRDGLPKPKVIATDPKFERLYQEVKDELADAKSSLAEMAELAASVKAFEDKTEFKEMQNLRAELRAVKQRRDELMRENAQQKKDIAYWKKKAGAK